MEATALLVSFIRSRIYLDAVVGLVPLDFQLKIVRWIRSKQVDVLVEASCWVVWLWAGSCRWASCQFFLVQYIFDLRLRFSTWTFNADLQDQKLFALNHGPSLTHEEFVKKYREQFKNAENGKRPPSGEANLKSGKLSDGRKSNPGRPRVHRLAATIREID